jgi:hypothetical protein
VFCPQRSRPDHWALCCPHGGRGIWRNRRPGQSLWSDLIDFMTDCLKKGQKGNSVYNKLVVISQVMKQHGRPTMRLRRPELAASRP